MLKSIKIENFKVHKKTELELRPITILTGINGMGKSSIIQALLLMRQSFLNGETKGLNLKGDLCDAGTALDVLCQEASNNVIGLCVYTDDEKLLLRCELQDGLDTFIPFKSDYDDLDVKSMSIFNDEFQYISAFRMGPQPIYTRDTLVVKQHRQVSKHLGMCEYAVHFLYEYGKSMNVLPSLRYPGTEFNQLEDQVAVWMSAIAPEIMIKIEPMGTDLKLNYRYKREGKVPTRDIHAINTGFGITYMLPLLVALLSARPGALIIIENPEAHIHPKAQAIFMELVAKCAQAGIQILLETHSDHIINGAMVAVHDGYPVEDVAVYYIERAANEHSAIVEMLDLRQTGRIMHAPEGFFDQINIDLERIVG